MTFLLLTIAIIAACYYAWRADIAERERDILREEIAWLKAGSVAHVKAAATRAAADKARRDAMTAALKGAVKA